MAFKSRSLFSFSLVYIDIDDYAADNLLAKHKVHIKITDEMVHPDTQYCLIFCKVRKKDIEAFSDAMLELQNKMLMLGHSDYEQFCENLFTFLEEKQKEKEDA